MYIVWSVIKRKLILDSIYDNIPSILHTKPFDLQIIFILHMLLYMKLVYWTIKNST